MLTQFFGNYLVDRKLITSDQLIYALRHKHEKNQTMAAMALSLGYMTEEETEDVRSGAYDRKISHKGRCMKDSERTS